MAKASPMAQLCWQEAPLFQLLVTEKEGSKHTVCFSRDFKPLEDMLTQEVTKHDLGCQCPRLLHPRWRPLHS